MTQQMYVCAVFDKKVAAFNNPMCFRTKGEAIRAFTDAVLDERNGFRRHAEDYVFMFCAQFDSGKGTFINPPGGAVPLITASECLAVDGPIVAADAMNSEFYPGHDD